MPNVMTYDAVRGLWVYGDPVQELTADSQLAFSLAALTATINGPTLDLGQGSGAGRFIEATAFASVVTGTSPTLAANVEDSPDNVTFTGIAGSTTANLTAAGTLFTAAYTFQRYVHLRFTIGGTTPSYTVAGIIKVYENPTQKGWTGGRY